MRAPPISCAQTARTSGTPAATSASCSSAERITALERSEEHTSELQSRLHLVCRLLLEKKKNHYIHSKSNQICSRPSCSSLGAHVPYYSRLYVFYSQLQILLVILDQIRRRSLALLLLR